MYFYYILLTTKRLTNIYKEIINKLQFFKKQKNSTTLQRFLYDKY